MPCCKYPINFSSPFSIQLDVDDAEMKKKKMRGTKRLTTTEPLYFGGVPDGLQILEGNAGSTTSFDGCIGDVTVNRK